MRTLILAALLATSAQAEMVTDLDGNVYDSSKYESYRVQFARTDPCACLHPGYFDTLEYQAMVEKGLRSIDAYPPNIPQVPFEIPRMEMPVGRGVQVIDVYVRGNH